ncbi:MAG TPA: hypothetical protein VMB21_08640, partial [Candidatus Limnocylindria bacterium]|nr:hypothetical protein [Candidatus Limnocylindria bacterium]
MPQSAVRRKAAAVPAGSEKRRKTLAEMWPARPLGGMSRDGVHCVKFNRGGRLMKRAVSASFAVLACVLAGPAVAQLEDKPVPMDKAPFHIPVFQNDYLILLNVNIPPGRNTGYHIHYADSVS